MIKFVNCFSTVRDSRPSFEFHDLIKQISSGFAPFLLPCSILHERAFPYWNEIFFKLNCTLPLECNQIDGVASDVSANCNSLPPSYDL